VTNEQLCWLETERLGHRAIEPPLQVSKSDVKEAGSEAVSKIKETDGQKIEREREKKRKEIASIKIKQLRNISGFRDVELN